MANHVRRQIREATASAITGLATTGARVFQSRVYPLQTTELPLLLVVSESETSTPITIHPSQTLERLLTLKVMGVAKATADLDDELDQICKEVEIALANPVAALAGLAQSITLTGTVITFDGTSERPTGRAEMTFEVKYFNVENAPDVAL